MHTQRPGQVFVVVAVATLLCSACESEPAPPAFTVRDSAGITIAENVGPSWSESEAPRLADAASLSIGLIDGDAPYLFTEIDAATRLSDGSIVVVDGAQVEVRRFDASGRYLRTIAAQGDGPGELQSAVFVKRTAGDTLAVQDWRRRTLELEALRGGHRTRRLLPVPDRARRLRPAAQPHLRGRPHAGD